MQKIPYCNTAYNNGYSVVIILNLFTYRATVATQVQQFYACNNYQAIMNVNQKIIQKNCNGRDVVFAWGKDSVKGRRQYPNYYDNAVVAITSTIISNTYYAVRCTCKNKSSLSRMYLDVNKGFNPLTLLAKWFGGLKPVVQLFMFVLSQYIVY